MSSSSNEKLLPEFKENMGIDYRHRIKPCLKGYRCDDRLRCNTCFRRYVYYVARQVVALSAQLDLDVFLTIAFVGFEGSAREGLIMAKEVSKEFNRMLSRKKLGQFCCLGMKEGPRGALPHIHCTVSTQAVEVFEGFSRGRLKDLLGTSGVSMDVRPIRVWNMKGLLRYIMTNYREALAYRIPRLRILSATRGIRTGRPDWRHLAKFSEG